MMRNHGAHTVKQKFSQKRKKTMKAKLRNVLYVNIYCGFNVAIK